MSDHSIDRPVPFFLRYGFSVIVSLVMLFVLYVIFGFYWDDWDRFLSALFYSGISAPTHDLWFNEVLLFQIPIIVFLSNYFARIPVYGLWHIFVLVIYVSIWLHLSLRIFGRIIKGKPWLVVLSGILSVYGVIGISLIYINVSRDSILMISGGILLYLDYYLFDQRQKASLILIFLLGCILRVSSGIIVLVAFTVLFLLIFRSFKKTIYLMRFHWAIVIGLFLITQANKSLANNPALTIEQTYEYALMDRGNVIPLSEMKSAQDSVRYEALTRFFLISDSAMIKLDFVKRVVDISEYMSLAVTKEDISHLSDTFFPILQDHRYIIVLLYVLLICVAWQSSRRVIMEIIILNVLCWLIILAIGVRMTMPPHFLLPWISMMIGFSLYRALLYRDSISSGQRRVCFVMLVPLSIAISMDLHDIQKEESEKNKDIYSYLDKINTLSQKSVPVLWDYTQSYFPTEVMSRRQPNIFSTGIYQTMFFLMYYRYGQERCLKQFGFSPLDWRSMNYSFHKNHDKLKFITEDKTAVFLGKYYKTLYNLEFKLVKDTPENEIVPKNFVYHLEEDSIIH